MWVVEVPAGENKSSLPAGGSPADDRAYLGWRDSFLLSCLDRDLASRWHAAADRPLGLVAWKLDARLFAALGGLTPLFATDAPNYQHRLRYLGICLRTRRRELLSAAHRYAKAIER